MYFEQQKKGATLNIGQPTWANQSDVLGFFSQSRGNEGSHVGDGYLSANTLRKTRTIKKNFKNHIFITVGQGQS